VLHFSKQKLHVCSSENNWYWKLPCLMNCISKRGTSLGDKNCIELCDRSHLCYKSIINYDLDITNILVVSPQIRYIEVSDIMKPRFNEQIWPVPSDFIKSRFIKSNINTIFQNHPQTRHPWLWWNWNDSRYRAGIVRIDVSILMANIDLYLTNNDLFSVWCNPNW